MKKSIDHLYQGYLTFREKYAKGDDSIMQILAEHGQKPQIMLVCCCDSRVDPALILQCQPGELFIARNVANIIPPYENDEFHHGTSAALEFAVCYLGIKHLIVMGHSQCGGIHALLHEENLSQNDFISSWVCQLKSKEIATQETDLYARNALHISYQNALSFPWIKQRVDNHQLAIHQWFFDIKDAVIQVYNEKKQQFTAMDLSVVDNLF